MMKKLLGILTMITMLALAGNVFAADEEVVIWKDGKLNVNGATKELLVKVGVEGELADSILELREESEEFVDLEELMDIDGVDNKKMRKLKQLLYVEAIPDCGC